MGALSGTDRKASHMNPQIPQLKSWLESHECNNVHPVKVTVGTTVKQKVETFEGCLYRRTLVYEAGMMAVQRGERKAGELYTECSAYLLGLRPEVNRTYKRRNKTCFTTAGTDWYVAAWIESKSIVPGNVRYHPFGESFIIKPWLLDEKIDAHERHHVYHDQHVPYSRFPITFEVKYL